MDETRLAGVAGLAALIGLCAAVPAVAAVQERPGPELLRIGVDFGEDHETFHRITAARFALDGRIVVLDGGDKVIKVYDRTGNFSAAFGGEGGGPGEFTNPTRIMVGEAVIGVVDVMSSRLTRFDYTGAVLATEPLGTLPGNTPVRFARTMRDGSRIAASLSIFSPGGPRHNAWEYLVRMHEGGVDTLAVPFRQCPVDGAGQAAFLGPARGWSRPGRVLGDTRGQPGRGRGRRERRRDVLQGGRCRLEHGRRAPDQSKGQAGHGR